MVRLSSFHSISVHQVHIVWLHETECHGEEEGPACLGLVVEEAAAVLEGEGEEEAEEDLRAASSVVGEGAEEGGADTFAPLPGELTWEMTTAFHGNVWTNVGIIFHVSTETWLDDVVTMTNRLLMFFVLLS